MAHGTAHMVVTTLGLNHLRSTHCVLGREALQMCLHNNVSIFDILVGYTNLNVVEAPQKSI